MRVPGRDGQELCLTSASGVIAEGSCLQTGAAGRCLTGSKRPSELIVSLDGRDVVQVLLTRPRVKRASEIL